jgi:hypothetical protein
MRDEIMDFPTTETNVMALSQKMLDGYQLHVADFPKIIRMKLYAYRNNYIVTRRIHKQAQATLRIATKAAGESFQELKQVMKNCLQKSQVDVTANPEKLKQIGWGPRTEPQPAQLPGQPTNLQIAAKDNQTIKLQWERPKDNRKVRNYIIEQRRENGDGVSNWTIFQIAYNTQTTLKSQPTGIRLEYRVRAANTTGESISSNTVGIIL